MKKFRTLGVTIQWIPSHLEIKGNEEADRQAKRAAKGDTNSSPNRLLCEFHDGLPNSRSAIQQATNKDTQKDTAHHLHKSSQWRKL